MLQLAFHTPARRSFIKLCLTSRCLNYYMFYQNVSTRSRNFVQVKRCLWASFRYSVYFCHAFTRVCSIDPLTVSTTQHFNCLMTGKYELKIVGNTPRMIYGYQFITQGNYSYRYSTGTGIAHVTAFTHAM